MLQKGMESQTLGLQVVRGDNMYALALQLRMCMPPDTIRLNCMVPCRAIIGEVDEEKDAEVDWSRVQAVPLKPLMH